MLIQNFYKIILFINMILYISSSKSIDYSKSKIKDMHTSFFNTKSEKIYSVGNLIKDSTIIGFTDLNYDKYTDIISYKKEVNNSFVFYENIYDDDNSKFKGSNSLFTVEKDKGNINFANESYVRNLYVGSFFEGKKYCFLITFENKNKQTLSHYIICHGDKDGIYLNITSNILIMNKDKDKRMRILFSDTEEEIISDKAHKSKTFICKLGKSIKDGCENANFEEYLINKNNADYLEYPLSLLGGLAYIDLSGNCVPDIVLSHDFKNDTMTYRSIEIYLANQNDQYELKDIITLDLNNKKYGAFAITRVNDDKSGSAAPMLDMLIPVIDKNEIEYWKNNIGIEYSWSNYYCDKYASKINIEKINKIFILKKTYSLDIDRKDVNITLDDSFPTVIRVGDFVDSSSPGLIVKQNIKDEDKTYSQITLYERDGGEFKYYNHFNISKLKAEYNDIAFEEGEEFSMGLFFDIDEAGTLSMILSTNKNKNFFFYNYRRNVYFIKSKLMNDKDYYYDVNLGASFRYIVTDKDGDRRMDVSFQMAQTSDMNIPLPYSLIGLDDTNNYVEYFESESGNILKGKGVEFEKSDEEDYKGNSPIIPNTQMMISKYYSGEKTIEWNVDLIVQPMEQIWLFFIIVVIVLLIVLGIIIYLHIKEVKEEQKETTKFKSWFA